MPDDDPPAGEDALADLRERIRATQEAAQRLADETADVREDWDAGREVPPRWSTAEEHARRSDEVSALVTLLETLRDLVPAELAEQVRELLRQALLLVRAIIDWWVARIERGEAPRTPAPPVEDIPVV